MKQDQHAATMNEILRLESLRSHAITSGDAGTLANLLSADHTYIHSSGHMDTRDEFISRIRTGSSNYHRLDFSNVRVRLLGDAAVVWGDAVMELRAPSRPRVLDLRFTNIWARIDQRWLNVHWIAAPNSPPQA